MPPGAMTGSGTSRPRGVFVSAPGGPPWTSPALGVARLAGRAGRLGWDVEVLDAKADIWRFLLSPRMRAWSTSRAEARRSQLSDQQQSAFAEELAHASAHNIGAVNHATYRRASRERVDAIRHMLLCEAKWRDVAERVAGHGASAGFRSACHDTDTSENRWPAGDDLTAAETVLSLAFYPTLVTQQGIFTRHSCFSSDGIMAAADDPEENPVVLYARDHLLPCFSSSSPDIVCISMVHPGEVIPGLTLARWCKETSPSTCVAVGGPTLALMADRLMAHPDIASWFDALGVSICGEYLLPHLTCGSRPAAERPGRPRLLPAPGGPPVRMRADDLSPPVFDASCAGRYLSYNVQTSLGCYWGRCTHCSYDAVSRLGNAVTVQRNRSPRNCVQDLLAVRAHSQAEPTKVYLSDSSIHPRRLLSVLESAEQAGIRVRLSAFARFEPDLADPGLCRKLRALGVTSLFLGLESACERVLGLMGKGVDLGLADRVLRTLHQAAIRSHLGVIVGFPTETEAEARDTFRWVMARRPLITSVEWNPFRLEYPAPLWRDRHQELAPQSRPVGDLGVFALLGEGPQGMSYEGACALCSEAAICFESDDSRLRDG